MNQGLGAVLDSSAVLALLWAEPGSEVVGAAISGSAISALNWSEVAQKAMSRGLDPRDMRIQLRGMGLRIIPFDVGDAEVAAQLWPNTRHLGLSLADRACLALGLHLGCEVITADRAWREVDIGVRVEVLRP